MIEIPAHTVAQLLYLVHTDPEELQEALGELRPADIAEALRELPPEAAAKVMVSLPFELTVQVFDDPELMGHRCAIIQRIDQARVGPLIEAMSADQQADLFREVPAEDRPRLLGTVSEATRASLEKLLEYSPQTAGGIMTTEYLSVPSDWDVERALALVREVGGRKETVYAIYIVDRDDQSLVHVVSLRELMTADREDSVLEVGKRRPPLTVTVDIDREEAARLISKYNLLAIPVVDDQRRMLGIVTVDDVIDALVEETTEDVQRFGGMEALDAPYMEIGFLQMIGKRAGWLCALFVSEMLTATAMQRFQGEIERAAVLAMFIPLVMSSGGNSGSQATSLVIRALALQEVKLRDWWRIAVRELPTGLVLGAILGVIGFTRIVLWQNLHIFSYGPHYFLLAVAVGFALVGIVAFGSLAGSMLPFLLKRIGFDPASASAPFVATLVDVTGLVIYFSVAFAVLHGTLL
ncbi:MAG TPA: magnesium transporter [Gemmatimonadaceae bacterium]|jgi:magnesium transporter|nr:magnesium transporter [Gemmatimonadaceae bacterium]